MYICTYIYREIERERLVYMYIYINLYIYIYAVVCRWCAAGASPVMHEDPTVYALLIFVLHGV